MEICNQAKGLLHLSLERCLQILCLKPTWWKERIDSQESSDFQSCVVPHAPHTYSHTGKNK